MSATSSGSGKGDNRSSPGASSTKVAGDVTEGNVDSACTSQTHSTTHGTQCETNPNLTGESNMSTPAQAQSKGETSKNDGKLADDKEKVEKNQLTATEQIKKPHLKETNIQTVETESTEGVFVDDDAMQGDQDHNSPRNKYQYKHFLEEKTKVPNAKPSAGLHVGQHNGGGNINSKEVVTDVVPSTLLARKSNYRDDTTTMSHANSSNQVDGITSPADNSNQVDGTTSQSDIANPGDCPTTSQADISNLRVGATTSQADNSNLRVGSTTSQANIANLGDGPTTSQADISNLRAGATTSQADIANLEDVPTTSQGDNSNLRVGATTSQTDIANLGDGPTTSQADNSNLRVGATTSQADIANQGDGQTTSQANYLNIGNGPTTSHTDNLNPEDVTKSQANSSNQVDGTTSQADNLNQGDGPTTSQADISNLRVGATSQTDIANLGDGPTLSQADISNLGDNPTTSQADIANVRVGATTSQADIANLRVGATTSQADISNLGDNPTTSQADIANVRVGATTSQANNANQGNGPISLQANISNLGNVTTTSQVYNSNPGDVMISTSQANNSKQTEGDNPNQEQAENQDQRDGMTSVLRNWDNTDTGAADNTEKVENDESFKLQAGKLDKRNESQSDNQVTDNANGQSEEGVTRSEHPPIPFFFSQSQDDFTVIEYQLEKIIDDILTDSTLYENEEEWKKKSKKKIKGFLLTKVEDGTLSQRCFHSNVTHIMPVQNVESDTSIHFAETCAKSAREARKKQRDEGGTSPTSHTQSYDPSKHITVPHGDVPFIDDDKNHQGPVQTIPPSTESSQTVLENPVHESSTHTEKKEDVAMLLNNSLSATTSKSLSSGDSFKKSLVKTKVTDMSEMTKETSSDLKHAYHNLFLGQTERAASDSSKGGEQSAKKMPINVQLDTQDVKEFDLPCSARNYFKWLYCLSNEKCLVTLKRLCNERSIDLRKPKDKSPVFMFPLTTEIVIEQLQRPFEETAKHHDIIYRFFDWDLNRPEKDLIGFCNHWNDTKTCSNVSLLFGKAYGKISFWLVGERPAVEAMKSSLKSELNRYNDSEFADAVEPYIWEKKVDDTCFKVFEKIKEALEMAFKVTISSGPNSKIKVTATSEDAITGVIGKVSEISKSVQSLKLPYVCLEFLNRSESAKVYLEQQLRELKIMKLHFLENDEYDTVQVFEENNTDLEYINKKIQELLFFIPSADELCQIFSFDEGKKEFSRLVEKNEGKVRMVLDESKQPCCVGTIDVKEKIENTLSRFRLKNDNVKIPSEEVWTFCAKHHMFQDIAKEASCEVKFAENKEFQWCVEVRGPVALLSKCCDRIEKEIRKVKSETILLTDDESFDESSVAKLIQKWNDEKRCFVNKLCVKAKPLAPWKKWIEKKGSEINMTYSANLNSSPGIDENELKLVLIPEQLTGARSKNPCDPIPGQSIVQISVPSLKTIDFVERGFKEVLKMNKQQWRKQKLIVDCERVPEKELKTSMKIICYTLDDTRGLDSCITMCEFIDTRLESFECMTKIIDAHFNNKDFEVLEWRGRSIEIDIIAGQLAQQKVFDVLVNSTSWDLDLKAGLTSRSILKVAGPGIQEECKKRYKRGIKMGDIAITEGHGLNCKHVFHGSLLSYNAKENFQSLRKMIRKCLETADKMKMESIAFPALGTGSLGYDRRDVANVLFEEVEKYENEVRLGSLIRLCCVIYQDDIDAVKEFQKRHKSWNESRKIENGLEEVRVTSDNPNVIEDIRQEVKQLKRQTATNIEPQNVEITENTRLGIPEEDAGSNHTSGQIKSPSKQGNVLSEERRCLLVKAKGECTKEDLIVWERSIREDLKDIAENIVFPFHSPNQALVQFATEKGVADIFSDNSIRKKYEVQKFPPQAVVDLKAVVSSRMTQILKERRITSKEIETKSGVIVQHNENDTIVLCGNILEIQAAYAFFASLVRDASHDVKERNASEKRRIPNAAQNDTAKDQVIEHFDGSYIGNAPKGNSTSSGYLKNLDQSSIAIINKPDPRQTPSTEMKFDKPKMMDIQCTEEDAIKLRHFHTILMENVEVISDTDQCTTVLRFHDEVTRKKVIENLDTIRHLPHVRCQVPNTVGIKDIIAKMCNDDTFCYMSEDCQHIEIVGLNRIHLTKIKEELEKLPTLEGQTDEVFFECQEIPVFVTNEGISVFVKRASLLDLKTPVDAIVCPLSKRTDLDYGLPNAIAGAAGPAFVSKLREIFDLNGEHIPEHYIYVIGTENIKSFSNVIIISTNRTHLRKKENDLIRCESFLLQLMLQIFIEAERKRMKSIAIPAICSGRKGFTKGLCAQCYGTSVMQYSRTIRHEGQGLDEIHFVDKLDEITSYIESVFTQPELTDMFEMRLQDMKKSFRVQQSWNPDYSENGIVSFSEYVSLTVLQSKVLKETPKDRTLVYHDILGKRLISKWLSDDKRKKLNNVENVYFLQNGLVASKLENVKLPIWNKDQDVAMFEKDLTAFYYNIFQEAEKQHIVNMIMPLYGYSKEKEIVTKKSAECFCKELSKFAKRLSSKSRRFDMIITFEDKSTKDIIVNKIGLLIDGERAGFQPESSEQPMEMSSKMSHSLEGRKQPDGHLSLKIDKRRLDNFKYDTIEIHVYIPNGIQKSIHPNPGKEYIGRKETLFLPDNKLGRTLAFMIVKAFSRKTLYDVQRKAAQGIEMVTETCAPWISKRENITDPKLKKLYDSLKSKVDD